MVAGGGENKKCLKWHFLSKPRSFVHLQAGDNRAKQMLQNE